MLVSNLRTPFLERCGWFPYHQEREKLLVTMVSGSDDAGCQLQGCPSVRTHTPESMRPDGPFHGHGFSSDPHGEESKVLHVRKEKKKRVG